jgi:aryl-alcohol dehydrogenase-like predicted oxidoreductase
MMKKLKLNFALFLALISTNAFLANAFSVTRNTNVNSINRIIYGTAALSKAENPIEMLDAAWDKGVRRFDLARTYGMGESERIFGEWLESRHIERNEIHIVTKGGIGMDRYGDADRPLLDLDLLKEEVDVSLDTLNVDHVDLYMYHRDDLRISVENFVDWMNEIAEAGKLRRWGVSNWSFSRFKAAHEYATENGLVPPSANSPQFSIAAPVCDVWPTTQSISQPHHEVEIQWYADNGVELLCWEVLAKGFMAKEDLWTEDEVDESSFDKPVIKGSDEWRLQRIQKAYCNAENYRRKGLAIKLANKSSLKLAQIAMLYPLTKGKHISVIFGSSKTSHIDDMIALQHLRIDEVAMKLFVDETILPSRKRSRRQIVPFTPQFVIDSTSSNVVAMDRKKAKRFAPLPKED